MSRDQTAQAITVHRAPGTEGGLTPTAASRRSFLGTTAAMSCAAAGLVPTGGLFAAGSERLRIGVVGCGGRGTGAALQAAAADPAVRVVALGDVFADQVASSAAVLAGEIGPQFDCPQGRRFVGEDAYRKVIESGVDIVLLAAPPHVRPLHLETAVAAGKHVYCEKPVAIDAAGVVRAAAASARGRAAGLAIASGFCFRHDTVTIEMMSRIHGGAIGRPLAVHAHAAIGLPWRKPVGNGPTEGLGSDGWRLQNWISFARYSGGHFVEHHVEAIDRALWIFGDVPPVLAVATAAASGGPTGAIGDCAAGTAVRYIFADGRTIEASIDRRERSHGSIGEVAIGSAGTCDLVRAAIAGRQRWAHSGLRNHRHQTSIDRLVGGILAGRVVNDGDTMCRSTLTAVMGRMAAAGTCRPVAWSEIVGGASGLA